MTAKEFYDSLVNDKALDEKLKGCKNPDDAYAVAKEAGCTDSMEDFVKCSEEINAKYKEMSSEEIDAISAAGDLEEATTVTVTTVTSITIGASAGAAAGV